MWFLKLRMERITLNFRYIVLHNIGVMFSRIFVLLSPAHSNGIDYALLQPQRMSYYLSFIVYTGLEDILYNRESYHRF